MPDELDYVREVCSKATRGPWKALPNGIFSLHPPRRLTGMVLCADDADAIALLGSTWREALAVIEAAKAEQKAEAALMLLRTTDVGGDLDDERFGLIERWILALDDAKEARNIALNVYCAAVREHQKRSKR